MSNIGLKKTTIQITMNTKDRLDKIGLKKDTYDDIIVRLLDHSKRNKRAK